MIFGLFGKKSRVAEEPDRIWRSSSREIDRVAAEAAAAERVLVVAHFRVTLERIGRALQHHGRAARTYTDRIGGSHLASASALDTGAGIAVALAQALPEPAKADGAGAEILVLVAGHHFVPVEDDRIRRYCEGLSAPARLRFHDSLESPLLALFDGASLATMMDKLGMKEDEAIEHAMVSRAIRSAQEKLAAKRTGDRAADSPEEWLRLNLPG